MGVKFKEKFTAKVKEKFLDLWGEKTSFESSQ
jgi:hypothetical protein